MQSPTFDRIRWALTTLLAAPVLLTAASATGQPAPGAPGWYVVQERPAEYAVGTEPARRPGSQGWAVATIRCLLPNPEGGTALTQSIRADDYRGQRVRLTGWLRTAGDSHGQAGLWMRVDGQRSAQAADFSTGRVALAPADWRPYSLVLDVPTNAVGITFGLAATGEGQVWLDDVSLEIVGRDVATTGEVAPVQEGGAMSRPWLTAYRNAPARPLNLDFEQRSIIAIR